jgi:hypothetical protein
MTMLKHELNVAPGFGVNASWTAKAKGHMFSRRQFRNVSSATNRQREPFHILQTSLCVEHVKRQIGLSGGLESAPGKSAERRLFRLGYQGDTPIHFKPSSESTAGGSGSGSNCPGIPHQ